MSQLENEPRRASGSSGNARPKLRLVENQEPPHAPRPMRVPGSGLAWARSYRSKLRLTDTVIIASAALAALVAQFNFGSAPELVLGLGPRRWAICGIIVVVWLTAMGTFHTRDHLIVGTGTIEYKRVITACTMSFGLLAMSFLVLEVDFPRRYFILVLPLGVIALTMNRWLWRQWLTRQRRFGHYLSRVIVVGSREDVEYVVTKIDEKMGAAYTVVGVVLDGYPVTGARPAADGFPVYSGLDSVVDAASAQGADAVIVAGQLSAGGEYIRDLAWELEGTAAELILASRLANVAGPRIRFRPVEGLPLIHVEIPQFDGGKHVLKRALDFTTSAAALLLLAPLLITLAVLIRSDSPGPALFRQERVARGGRTFRMLKFRSMVATATEDLAGLLDRNEAAGVLFKMKDDPRVTRIGRVLRKYSLDELPQLWNILVGDMSLVGPRPPLRKEVLGYKDYVHRRLYIKPGLTGMWQVNGRSDLNWEESVRLDLYYVENWSLVGDLVIIWRTLKVLIHPVGAY